MVRIIVRIVNPRPETCCASTLSLRADCTDYSFLPIIAKAYGDPDGYQQQELLALVAVAGDASRNDERLVEGTGAGEYP